MADKGLSSLQLRRWNPMAGSRNQMKVNSFCAEFYLIQWRSFVTSYTDHKSKQFYSLLFYNKFPRNRKLIAGSIRQFLYGDSRLVCLKCFKNRMTFLIFWQLTFCSKNDARNRKLIAGSIRQFLYGDSRLVCLKCFKNRMTFLIFWQLTFCSKNDANVDRYS